MRSLNTPLSWGAALWPSGDDRWGSLDLGRFLQLCASWLSQLCAHWLLQLCAHWLVQLCAHWLVQLCAHWLLQLCAHTQMARQTHPNHTISFFGISRRWLLPNSSLPSKDTKGLII